MNYCPECGSRIDSEACLNCGKVYFVEEQREHIKSNLFGHVLGAVMLLVYAGLLLFYPNIFAFVAAVATHNILYSMFGLSSVLAPSSAMGPDFGGTMFTTSLLSWIGLSLYFSMTYLTFAPWINLIIGVVIGFGAVILIISLLIKLYLFVKYEL